MLKSMGLADKNNHLVFKIVMLYEKKYNLIRIIFGFFLIILTIVSDFLLLKEIKGKTDKYIETRDELTKIDKKIELLSSQEKILKDVRPDLLRIDKVFLSPDQDKVAEFISGLESLAQQNGIILEVKSAASPVKDKQYFTFQIFLKGSFSNLFRFMTSFEDSPEGFYRLIEIKKLNMQRVIKDDNLETETILEVRVYIDM